MYTVNQTAKILNVNPITVRKYVMKKKIESTKTKSGGRRFTAEHINDFAGVEIVPISKNPNGAEK